MVLWLQCDVGCYAAFQYVMQDSNHVTGVKHACAQMHYQKKKPKKNPNNQPKTKPTTSYFYFNPYLYENTS